MWTLVLYTAYRLSLKKTPKIRDIIEALHDQLYLRYRISIYSTRREIVQILRNLEEHGLIKLKCHDDNVDECIIELNYEKCRRIIETLEEYAKKRNTLLGEVFRIVRELA